MLKDWYLMFISENYPDSYNPDYQTHKVKDKIVKLFGIRLQFWLPQAACKSELVFSAIMDIGEAIEALFDSISSDTGVLERAATILSNGINSHFSNLPPTSWSPSASTLEAITLPQSLLNFVTQVISGRAYTKLSDKAARIADSGAANICNATTKGRLNILKHVALGLTVHHLTGSAEKVTILNRLGHCCCITRLPHFIGEMVCYMAVKHFNQEMQYFNGW